MNPYRRDAPVKSLCAPYTAIVKCVVEQPLFGANYIEATVREEADPQKTFVFKLKFPKGGAIDLARTMNRIVSRVDHNQRAQPYMQPPPAYTPSPAAQYYQAPPNVYSPGYDCGVQMPIQQFPGEHLVTTSNSEIVTNRLHQTRPLFYPIIIPVIIPI